MVIFALSKKIPDEIWRCWPKHATKLATFPSLREYGPEFAFLCYTLRGSNRLSLDQ
jgi:hypothetical protein